MRRLLALMLLLAFGSPLIAQALALTGDPDVKLLACCRRNGAHQCVMSSEVSARTGQSTQIGAPPARCPAFPQAVTPSQHHHLAAPTGGLFFAEINSHPAITTQVEARARLTLEGTRQKRGPPAFRLS